MNKKIKNKMIDILSKPLKKSGGKLTLMIYLILNIFAVIAMIILFIQGDMKHVMACLKIMLLFLVPWIIEWKLKIELSSIFITIIQIFMYAAIILGELDSFYLKFAFWDTILHAICGFLSASVGFMMINRIQKHRVNHKLVIKPLYAAIFAFCLSMTISVMWEFYEFGMDNLFSRDMQKDTVIHTIKSVNLDLDNPSLTILNDITEMTINGKEYELGGYLDIGLYDTMGDLFNNFVGTLVFCVIGYYVTKKEYESKIISCFIYCTKNST